MSSNFLEDDEAVPRVPAATLEVSSSVEDNVCTAGRLLDS